MRPFVLAFFAAILLDAQQPLAVHAVDNWAKLPDGWNLGECSGVAVDKSDNVWIFNMEGQIVATLGGHGKAPGKFDFPHGIAVDSTGAIYVAEIKNWRVQKFVK